MPTVLGLCWHLYSDQNRTTVGNRMADITLTVKRTGDTDDSGSYWQSFTVPEIAETMSVLDALIWTQQNIEPTLAFRRACRVKMCGTCGVRINGREGVACGTLGRSLVGARGGEVRVEPMRHLPVVRDLVTDPGVFYQRLNQVGAAFTPKDDSLEPAQIMPDSKERKTINPHRECIYCGLCYSACSVAGLDSGYLGPAALNRAFALVSASRDGTGKQRLQASAGDHGIWRCHTIFECTAVCPKGIPITEAIEGLKRKVFVNKLKSLIGLGR